MPVEGRSRQEILAEHGAVTEMLDARLGAGTYTDDTEMTIGVAESLLRRRGMDGMNMAATFANGYGEDRGYSLSTLRLLQRIKQGEAWDQIAPSLFEGGGSYGNGSAMRVAPVGLLYHNDPERLDAVAREQARITHSHELGQEGAALAAHAVAMAVRLSGKSFSPRGFLEALMGHIGVHGRPFRAKLMAGTALLEKRATPEQVAAELGNDATSIGSVPTAIYSFAANMHSLEKAIVYAVNLRGDTDTIAAMTGAIAGAYHGEKAIPARWLDVLENGDRGRDYVRSLGTRLALYWAGLPEGAPACGH
jgi:poly(ADP-ribose) glycohydrolase ARH3